MAVTPVMLVSFTAASLCVTSSTLHAQSFLEKLESAVRERLNEGATAPSPVPRSTAEPGAASPELKSSAPNNASSTTAEELPSPKANAAGTAGVNSSSQPALGLPSILEGGNRNSVPALTPVPPPTRDAPTAAPSVGADENDRPRIYLGLEAEEVVGGGIGVVVSNVTQDSPAWKAGFQRGDRIMGINGYAIANLDDMVGQLAKTFPGQTAKFLVSRAERNLELVAVLMEAGLAERIAGSSLPTGPLDCLNGQGPPWLGVAVSDLTPAFRNQFGLNIFRGAAITSVSNNSPAAKVGILAGDVITAVGGIRIETAQQVMDWMRSARPGSATDITYHRGNFSRTVQVTLEVSPELRGPRTSNRRPATGALRSAAADNSLYNDAVPAGPVAEEPVVGPVPAPVGVPQPNPAVAGTDGAEIAALRRQVAVLQAELDDANQRLESTQAKLKQILEGLGKALQ